MGTEWYLIRLGQDINNAREIRLRPGSNDFGRHVSIQNHIKSPFCSVHQCQLMVHRDTVRLWDRNSTNGTFVNGIKYTGGPVFLCTGDHIGFGTTGTREECMRDKKISCYLLQHRIHHRVDTLPWPKRSNYPTSHAEIWK